MSRLWQGIPHEFFVVVHHPEAVKTHWLELYELAMHMRDQKPIRNVKRSAYVGEWDTFSVPCYDKEFVENVAQLLSQLCVDEVEV